MPFGYTGKILHVDLSRRKIETEEPGEVFYRSYLGRPGHRLPLSAARHACNMRTRLRRKTCSRSPPAP